ncbi:MAG: PQQ-binding-like beta-propeller repeat protein [Candidatus Aureabacteria bacterium]|nr:PQQ-binding-like beta-propeller repeat protein [Candidatus Auribacterota bacterium]
MRAKVSVVVVLGMVFAAANLSAGEGAWQQVGKAGDWANTIAGAALNDRIYTAESSGALYATDPSAGTWKQIGKPDFAGTQFLFAASGKLFSIEKSGSLYSISPDDGSWAAVGKAGDWVNTIAGTVLGDHIYTVESSGALYATDSTAGTWKQIGKPAFAACRFLLAASGKLFSIENSGSLYGIDPEDGSWVQVGKTGDWVNTIAGTVLGDQIYTVESSGALYATNPDTGVWKQIGKPDFAGARFIFVCGGSLFAIEESGNLYRVDVGAGASPAAVSAPAAPVEAVPAPSEKSEAALAGSLTFAFLGKWKGDTTAYEKDPVFAEQAKSNPQMAQGLLAMLQSAAMTVTLDGITMEVMGEKAGPFAYSVISAEGGALVIENEDGPKKGVQSTITFQDKSRIKVVEGGKEAQAMYFIKN